MSLRANYYKLGLFVIGAVFCAVVILLVVGSGRWFTAKLTIESYFDESVQGLDIGSKLKYRGVVIGDVTRITFTYNRYQLDKPVTERARYVLVEAEIQPRQLGGRAAAGDLTDAKNSAVEVERGLRMRLAPQGITGTSYLEIDYVDPAANPVLPIEWTPANIYIPSARSTLTSFVNAASEIIDRLRKLDVESTMVNLNTLLVTTNERVGAIDTRKLGDQANRTMVQIESSLKSVDTKRLSDEGAALLAELRQSNAELKSLLASPALKRIPENADAAVGDLRKLINDPKLAAAVAHLERTLARLERITGGSETNLAGTIENLRQITENLRDLTETAKRHPSGLLFGEPPTPLERTR
ncbi:MAG: MlaD family protein [Betaproteobacteria bacterium]|jgi:ABC-type transporter Mla subunit MlaD|nr:MlaD family protein [Betaproteobacteria bacterium]